MILHNSRAVLATVIWTILLTISTQKTIIDGTSVEIRDRSVVSSKSAKETIDRKRDIGNSITVRPNGERKSPIGTNTGDDTVDYAVGIVVEKRHVRRYASSQAPASARISTENMKTNNGIPKGTAHEEKNNERMFELRREILDVSSSRNKNNDVARDKNSSWINVSNVSRTRTTTKDVETTSDESTVLNESSSKGIVRKRRDTKLKEIVQSSVLLIDDTKSTSATLEPRNSNPNTRRYESDYTTKGSAPKAMRSGDANGLMEFWSLGRFSREKDQRTAKVIRSAKERHESGSVSSLERRETILSVKSKSEDKGRDDGTRSVEATSDDEPKALSTKKQSLSLNNEDSGISRSSMENSSEIRVNRVTTPRRLDRVTSRFTAGLEISRETSKESYGQIPKPPDALMVETSVLAENIVAGYEHSTPRDSSALDRMKNPHGFSHETVKEYEHKSGEINYYGRERVKGRSYFATSLSNEDVGISVVKVGKVTNSNEAEKKLISRGVVVTGNNEQVLRPSSESEGRYGSETSPRLDEFVDNPTKNDRTRKIYRNVVRTTSTPPGLQILHEGHETLIEERSTRGISLGSPWNDRGKLARVKQVEQVSDDVRREEMDGSPARNYHASSLSSREASLANLEASTSSTLAMKRDENASVSSKSVITERERKIKFSDYEEIRPSRKIKTRRNDNDGVDDDYDDKKTVSFTKEIAKVEQTTAQFSRAIKTENNAAGDRDSVILENRKNFIERIDQNPRTTDTSMDSTLAEVHPWDFDPNDDDDANEKYEGDYRVLNDDEEMREVVATVEYRTEVQKLSDQRREGNDRGVAASSVLQKSEANNLSMMTLESNETATMEIGVAGTIDVISNDQRDVKSPRKDSDPDMSDKITDHRGYNPLVERPTTLRLGDSVTKDDFMGRKTYIGGSKIDDTKGVPVVNRLKLRDSTKLYEDDFHRSLVAVEHRIDDEISDAMQCETCTRVSISENVNENRKIVKNVYRNDQRQSNRANVRASKNKIVQSINVVGGSRSAIRGEITNKSKTFVDLEFTNGDERSLAKTGDVATTIDHTEESIGERIQRGNTRMLVRSQEPIIKAAIGRNLIVSREQPSATIRMPASIVKLNNSREQEASLDKTRDQRNESFQNLPSSVVDISELNLRTATRINVEEKHQPRIATFAEIFENEKIGTEFSNRADDVPEDREKSGGHATPRIGNKFGSDRRWKPLVNGDATRSTTKIDRLDGSIDRPSTTENVVARSRTDTRTSEISNNVVGPSDLGMKQTKRGVKRADSIPRSSTRTTTRPSQDYRDSGSTEMSEDPDNDFTEVTTLERPHSMLVEDPKVSKNDERLASEISISIPHWTNAPTADVENLDGLNELYHGHHVLVDKIPPTLSVNRTNVNTTVLDTVNYNLTTVNTTTVPEHNLTGGGTTEFGKPQLAAMEKEPREMRRNVAQGSAMAPRPLNQTISDNSTRITATSNQWPVKHSAVVEGDLVLGGLMMVHEREDSVTCGPVMPQGGVQALEAMLYTLDWLNERDLVPGVKIGAHILDDCDKDTYGLEMAVDFIKGSISNIDGAEYHCNKTAVRKVISGVVGAASSVTSIQVANLLRLFKIPQVSFFSTSPELSNKMRFEYFTRTIPSDHYQVKAMVDIVLKMGWSYVSIIYEESNYGEKAYEELEKLLGKHQICIAVKEKLSKDSGVAEAHVYDNIVLKLLTKPRARGCIIFGSDQEVAGVMRAVRRCNATGAFSWIGSDGWSARSLVSDGNEPEMEGTLSVQPQANPVVGFEDYFLNLTVENNRRNPWFVEFWEDHFKCRYPNSSQTPYNNYTEECTTTERLTKQNTAFEDQLQFVSDAVLAFAYAFRTMHSRACHGKPGLCDAMKPTKGTELLADLRNVKFDGLSGDVFHFDKNGDGPARYNIIHFKQVSPGKYKWIKVGEYLEGVLRLNTSVIQFRLGHSEAPESVCSLPCEVGQAKKYVEGESCCWHCFNCTQYQIRHVSDEKQCVLCPQGTVPDETHSYCRDIPEEFLRPESGWAIGAMSFSSTGILITLFVGGVFLKHNDTPIVRASGRELSYVLLTGILLCYLVTFALVLKPTDLVCSIQRFSAGFCFTVVYAALLTKTNRISRIFNAGKRSAKRPSFISPRSQLIICSMLVAIQILINGVWMVIDPAKARHHYPTREDNLLVCNSYIDASYMIAFTYPIILIVVCTVYAVLTRKIPEAFNESKHIGFTMYTTCVIWLAFVPLYFATGNHVALRITSMSVTISLSASVTIACLFTPKLYIILIHPERNVRPNMMHHRYNTTKGSVVTATNASSMMAPVTLTAVTCDQNKAVKKHVITTMDCSTQSEQFDMEMKDRKNGKFPPSVITRSTQTLMNNNGKESSTVTSPVIKDINIEENIINPIKVQNIGKIGNGPLSQNEVPL